LIEDCAQALGASYLGRTVGTVGRLGIFSFQASKTITSGEGGALAFEAPSDADLAHKLANNGSEPGGLFTHSALGSNYRMSEFHAAVLCSQLDTLSDLLDQRNHNASMVENLLSGESAIQFQSRAGEANVHGRWSLSFVYRPECCGWLPRHDFIDALRAEGLIALPMYPRISDLSYFAEADRVTSGGYFLQPRTPIAERLTRSAVSLLGLFLMAADESVPKAVAHAVRRVIRHGQAIQQALNRP
jgi:3-amino-5-hydroxybenzoate synthase